MRASASARDRKTPRGYRVLGLPAWVVLVILFVGAFIVGAISSCQQGGTKVDDSVIIPQVNETLETVSAGYDARLFVCEVTADVSDGVVTLSGLLDAVKLPELEQALKAVPGVREVIDNTLSLPDATLGPDTAALVSTAVANLGDAPGQDEGEHMVTQARLADRLEVLREKDGWYQVRMADDGYLGWIRADRMVSMTPAQADDYASGEQVQITAKLADVVALEAGGSAEGPGDETGAVILRAVMGTVLPVSASTGSEGIVDGSIAVILPGGKTGLVSQADVRDLPSAVAAFAEKRPASDIIALAERFQGLAYLWGGTTTYGFDCSGFVQFVFGMNGYQLPRDADMQYAMGNAVSERSELRPGDIVFWSTYKAGPSHVGIYIGDGRYIQSGSSGIAIFSFDPGAADYSQSLDQAYLGARRVLGGGE